MKTIYFIYEFKFERIFDGEKYTGFDFRSFDIYIHQNP